MWPRLGRGDLLSSSYRTERGLKMPQIDESRSKDRGRLFKGTHVTIQDLKMLMELIKVGRWNAGELRVQSVLSAHTFPRGKIMYYSKLIRPETQAHTYRLVL